MRSLLGLLIVLLIAPAVQAVDLTKIERTIAKEPAYAGKPKYCLLVFGPEAKTRIWLALDGDKLYVDRNGNGDLTDDGPAIAAKVDGEGDGALRSFVAPEIRVGPLVHKQLIVNSMGRWRIQAAADQSKEKAAQSAVIQHVGLDLEIPGRQGEGLGGRVECSAGIDSSGYLQFAATARDAPIVHFGGQWSITLYSRDDQTVGREEDLVLSIGTPGVGTGATAWVGYEGLVPAGLKPTAEITFPPKAPGKPPIKTLFELKERC